MYFPNYNFNNDYKGLLPITAFDSSLVRSMKMPAALVQAHSAPMGIEFSNNSFDKEFRNGIFVAYRGSWNRSPATGYKVVFLGLDDFSDTTANYVADFVSGFLTDSISGSHWARPVGLETDNRGNLYLGSDAVTTFVMVIYRETTSSTGSNYIKEEPQITVYPIPAKDIISINITNVLDKTDNDVSVALYDLLGRNLYEIPRSYFASEMKIDIGNIPIGLYQLIIKIGNKLVNKPIIINK